MQATDPFFKSPRLTTAVMSEAIVLWRAAMNAPSVPEGIQRAAELLRLSLDCADVTICLRVGGPMLQSTPGAGTLPEALAMRLTQGSDFQAPTWLDMTPFGLPGTAAWLPLIDSGVLLGVALARWDAQPLAEITRQWLAVSAEVTAYVLKRALYAADILRIERHLAVRDAVLAAIGRALTVEKALQDALVALCAGIGCEVGAIYLLDTGGRELVLAAQHGLGDTALPARLPAGASPWQQALAIESFVVVDDLANRSTAPGWARAAKIVQCLAARVRAPDLTLGLIVLGTHSWQPGFSSDGPLLHAVGLELGVAVDRLHKRDAIEVALAERNARWLAVYEMSAVLMREHDADRLFDEIVRRSIALLRGSGGALILRDETSDDAIIAVAHDRNGSVKQAAGTHLKPGEGLSWRIFATGQPLVADAYAHWPKEVRSYRYRDAIAVAAVPVFIRGQAIGALTVSDDITRHFTEDDVQTLTLFGQLASRVLEGQMNMHRAEALALQGERIRLANELHEGLAQDLASLLLRTDLAQTLVPEGDSPLREQLELLSRGLQRCIREARASIFSLRAGVGAGELEAGLRTLAQRFEAEAKVPVVLAIDGESAQRMSQLHEMALIRVAQEALNNIRKHAHARQVWLELCWPKAGGIVLSIRDDGIGIEARKAGGELTRQFGLLFLREQIEKIGGNLEIVSGSGQGTTVRVTLPAAGQDGGA